MSKYYTANITVIIHSTSIASVITNERKSNNDKTNELELILASSEKRSTISTLMSGLTNDIYIDNYIN